MNEYIKKALRRADEMKDDDIGFIAYETPDGMVEKIWYRTIGCNNVLVKNETVTLEQWEWEKYGCKNNEEWRRYLNKQMWRDYTSGLRTE